MFGTYTRSPNEALARVARRDGTAAVLPATHRCHARVGADAGVGTGVIAGIFILVVVLAAGLTAGRSH
jgi:hypothetical protein